jgi:hypothetical protein
VCSTASLSTPEQRNSISFGYPEQDFADASRCTAHGRTVFLRRRKQRPDRQFGHRRCLRLQCSSRQAARRSATSAVPVTFHGQRARI